jgi:hypothetical protein
VRFKAEAPEATRQLAHLAVGATPIWTYRCVEGLTLVRVAPQNLAAALAQLVDTIDSATKLPDPSAPLNGNGSAYDKFPAIYNDLRVVTSAVDQTV